MYIPTYNKQGLINGLFGQNPLADPGWRGARDPHPLSVQFLSFSCSFRRKPCQMIGFRPKLNFTEILKTYIGQTATYPCV